MTEPHDVISDLVADGDDLDQLLAGLAESQWALPTPAVGWTIAHQVAHLAATFHLAATAASDPVAFQVLTSRLGDDFDAAVHAALSPYLAAPPESLLARWRAERAAAEKALGAVAPGQVVPWLVRPLPAPVLAAAGMMELFGHGQDIADALGVTRQHTDRIRHLAGFAVRTWDFGYLARGLAAPDAEFRFELTAPSGAPWSFGPTAAAQRITGPAVDFCLLVTRRRHRADLALVATGSDADRWLDLAQAYRGPAGPGRLAGQFA
ncbi:MAG: TIGR03084 family protein [Actinobacteria bacterium]|nr:TIGR03084 family protein [Actinomycetota bacterium]MBI3686967.1 TIGR03084 family protein [Actinomycetota bacterium]